MIKVQLEKNHEFRFSMLRFLLLIIFVSGEKSRKEFISVSRVFYCADER